MKEYKVPVWFCVTLSIYAILMTSIYIIKANEIPEDYVDYDTFENIVDNFSKYNVTRPIGNYTLLAFTYNYKYFERRDYGYKIVYNFPAILRSNSGNVSEDRFVYCNLNLDTYEIELSSPFRYEDSSYYMKVWE